MKNQNTQTNEYLEEIAEINMSIAHANAFGVPNDPSCCKHLADLHYRKGILYSLLERYRQALVCLDDAISCKEDYAEAYYQKGSIFRSHINDSEQAVIALDEAIRINAHYAEAYDLRGYSLMDLGQYRAAAESFEQVIRVNSAMGYRLSSRSFEESVRLSAHDMDWFELTHSNGYGGKALALEKLEDWEGVLECYNKLLIHQPSSEHHHHGKGKALSKLGRHEEAVACFNIALSIQPNNPIFLSDHGLALAHLGYRTLVEQNYARLLALEATTFPGCAGEFQFQKGMAMTLLGDKEAALACFDLAVSAKPDHYRAHQNKGVLLHALGRINEALDCFDKATSINPAYVAAHKCKLLMLVEKEQYLEVVQCFSKLIEIDPDNGAMHYNNKGWYLSSKLGKHEAALECIDESLRIDSKSANTYHSRGFILSALGRYEEAIACFDTAIRIDHDCSEAYEDKQKAIKMLRQREGRQSLSMTFLKSAPEKKEEEAAITEEKQPEGVNPNFHF